MLFSNFFKKPQPDSTDANTDSATDEISEQLTEQAKQLEYKKILQQSRFVELDGLNEYDEDYRFFIPRGELLTVEMRNALQRLEVLDQQSEQIDEASSLLENHDSDHEQAG